MLRLGKAGDPPCTQVLQLEESADLIARAIGDHQHVWGGESLQSRRKVRGFADRGLLSCVTFPDRFSDHYQAGRDADADAQVLTMDRPLADRGDHGEPRAHSPLGVRLLRLRPAEIDQYPVADITRDEAAKTRDCGPDAGLIAAHDRTQVLRIKPCRE